MAESIPIGCFRYDAQMGFTLLEVMIAAAILGMTIAGVTSLIGTGRALDSSSRLRAQAMSHAANSLDRVGKHFTAYPVTAGSTTTFPVLTTESGAACVATQTDSIYDPIPAFWVDAIDGIPDLEVPYQRFTTMIFWNCGGISDTVVLRKRLADVK